MVAVADRFYDAPARIIDCSDEGKCIGTFYLYDILTLWGTDFRTGNIRFLMFLVVYVERLQHFYYAGMIPRKRDVSISVVSLRRTLAREMDWSLARRAKSQNRGLESQKFGCVRG